MLNSKALEAAYLRAGKMAVGAPIQNKFALAKIISTYLTTSMPEDVKGLVRDLTEQADYTIPHSPTDRLYDAATALASLSAQVEELTLKAAKKDALWRETAEQAQENFDNWLRDIEKLKTAEASLAERDRIIAEKDKAYGPLVDAAHGLSFGTDWNNGNHAKKHGYRQKLLDALPAARAARDRRAS